MLETLVSQAAYQRGGEFRDQLWPPQARAWISVLRKLVSGQPRKHLSE